LAGSTRTARATRARRALRPADLGRAIKRGAQMVRRYERWGFVPPAERSPSGRRQFEARHRHAIIVARAIQAGYGWRPGGQILRLRVVTLLRQHGYQFDAIRGLLDELTAGRPATTLSALERRGEELVRRSERCARATAALWGYVAELMGKLPAPSATTTTF